MKRRRNKAQIKTLEDMVRVKKKNVDATLTAIDEENKKSSYAFYVFNIVSFILLHRYSIYINSIWKLIIFLAFSLLILGTALWNIKSTDVHVLVRTENSYELSRKKQLDYKEWLEEKYRQLDIAEQDSRKVLSKKAKRTTFLYALIFFFYIIIVLQLYIAQI